MADKKKRRKSNRSARKPIPLPALIAVDIVITGLALLVFAYYHHVRPQEMEALNIVSTRPGMMTNITDIEPAAPQTAEIPAAGQIESADALNAPDAAPTVAQELFETEQTPSPEPTAAPVPVPTETPEPEAPVNVIADATLEPTPSPEPAPTPDPPGYFGTKFADKFSDGEVIFTDSSYQSANVNIRLETKKVAGAVVHVADIYIRDISSFRAALANEGGKNNGVYKSSREDAKDIAARSKALVSMTGDFYSMRDASYVLRNGVLYRDKPDPDQDICVLYWDGTIRTVPSEGFDVYREIDRGAYQIWSFGPMLLDENGNALSTFNHDLKIVNNGLTRKKSRTGLGYYEPGHYCFVAVDGNTTASHGLSMASFSEVMHSLGCVRAYNFDGGQSAQMYVGTKVFNVPEDGGRRISDMLVIVEPEGNEMERAR